MGGCALGVSLSPGGTPSSCCWVCGGVVCVGSRQGALAPTEPKRGAARWGVGPTLGVRSEMEGVAADPHLAKESGLGGWGLQR